MDHPDSCTPEAKTAIAQMKRIKTSFDEILAELIQPRSKELIIGKGRIVTRLDGIHCCAYVAEAKRLTLLILLRMTCNY
jgi:hypothetical protein